VARDFFGKNNIAIISISERLFSTGGDKFTAMKKQLDEIKTLETLLPYYYSKDEIKTLETLLLLKANYSCPRALSDTYFYFYWQTCIGIFFLNKIFNHRYEVSGPVDSIGRGAFPQKILNKPFGVFP